MGAFLGNLFEKMGTKIPEALRSTPMGESAHDLFWAKDDFFKMGGRFGEALRSAHMNYQELRSKFESQLNKPVQDLVDGIYKDPALKNINKNSTISQIHTMLPAGHPAKSASTTLVSRGSQIANAKLSEIGMHNTAEARKLASAEAFGPKMQKIIPFIMDAFDTGDPLAASWARGAMNLISNETHDTTHIMRGLFSKEGASQAKIDIQDTFLRENKDRALMGESQLPQVDVSATYHAPEAWERRINQVLRTVQLPFVALKHIPQVANLASTPARSLISGLLSMGDVDFKRFLEASHILAFTEHDMLDRNINGRFGKMASWTGNRTLGQLFWGSYHMPFFDTVRHFQLSLSASVGYQSARMWAKEALNGGKRALLELKEMGIDVNEVIRNNGDLTDDQIKKAMFHFTNNRFFMDKSIERSMLSNKDVWRRSATMYHTFVNAQQRFIRRELTKMLKAGDYVSIAQFAGTLGILYPAVAPILKSLEILGRTGSPASAVQSAEQDYDKLRSGHFKDVTSTYLDLLAHYGAFGVYTSYVAAAHGNRLAYQLMGPTTGIIARGLEDSINAATKESRRGKHNFKPIMRDVLEDAIPVLGNIAAHKLIPTEKEKHPSRIPRHINRRRR